MRKHVPIILWCLPTLLSSAIGMSCSDGPRNQATPDETIPAVGRGGGFLTWGATTDLIYGTSVKPEIVDMWKWNRQTMLKSGEFPTEGTSNVHLLCRNWFVGVQRPASDKENWPLVVRMAGGAKEVSRWMAPVGYWFRWIGVSQEGKCIALVVEQEAGTSIPDCEVGVDKFRIGLLGLGQKEISWLTHLESREGNRSSIRAVMPSEDGAYVALAGWRYGIGLIDVAGKKLSWVTRPKDEAGMVDVAFSPDAKVLYGGGTEGCIYGMEVASGRIVSRWFATDSGKSEYGWRVSVVAVSPDGHFVAAGTGPEGVAYVWDRNVGKLVGIFRHGGSTIQVLSFSPDSNSLATFVPGTIKVWKLRESSPPATRASAVPETRESSRN
jgi:hypothetical protein